MIVATDIFCLNELGRRANNEDCVSPAKGRATLADDLFVVCDGVGGENKGEVASEIVCAAICEHWQKHRAAGTNNAQEMVQKAIQAANAKLTAHAATDDGAKRMSTTLALVLLAEENVVAAWCGDTRIHHIRQGRILWKSRDHSLVSELVSQGELTEEEARRHPRRNVITRSLNALAYNNTVDFHTIEDFETGDYLLLCTDGFLENVSDKVLHDVLLNEAESDKAKAFLRICEGATRDNFSMYLIKGTRLTKKKKKSSGATRLLFVSVIILLLSLLAFLLF